MYSIVADFCYFISSVLRCPPVRLACAVVANRELDVLRSRPADHALQCAMLRLTPGLAGVIVQIHKKRPETTSTFALQFLQMDSHRLQIHAGRSHRTIRDGCSHVSEGDNVW